MKHSILGLVGASGSGKTTLARRLTQDYGFVNLHMGRPIKDMLRALGLSEDDVAGTRDQRERPHPLLGGKSARYALSTLGTDWGRRMMAADLWANAMRRQLQLHLTSGSKTAPVVVDDLRFPSDWNVVQELGGLILTIRRPGKERKRTVFDLTYYHLGLTRLLGSRGVLGWRPLHESELYWPDAPAAAEVWNTSTVDDLVSAALAHWH
jgi:hypothetical protein